ncbi:uncharacterized protein LOC129597410 [Paramacrobiotus metropolitanus]|uniref:uncharacterized protein LOC129597410 n=1 Tax=Paramacrobiotus metropolitanus TaxID=2943436 RepID=UPI0024460A88|nr:uncharacterized protein LOC129597410 [Paramacrobiotus metropolitanus]
MNTTAANSSLGFIQSFTYLQWLASFSCLTSLTGNLTLLYLYYRTRSIITPFSVAVINLLISNVISAIFQQNPFLLGVKNLLLPSYWPKFCTFFRFVSTATGPLIPVAHMLITLNRVCAITWPVFYRAQHTKKMAVLTCLGSWIVVQLYAVPAITVDAFLYLDRMDNIYCTFRDPTPVQTQWLPAYNWLFYVLPEMAVAAAYPYFLFKRRTLKTSPMNANPDSHPVHTISSHIGSTPSSKQAAGKRPSIPITLLSLMTFSIVICWTPMNLYFLAAPYLNSMAFLQVCRMLKLIHMTIDPVIFGAAVPELRTQARQPYRSIRTFQKALDEVSWENFAWIKEQLPQDQF